MAPPRVSGVRRLGALLQQAREPVFLLDGQRRLLFANRAWEELTGHSEQVAAGLECVPQTLAQDGSAGLAALGSSFSPPPEALRGHPSGGPSLIIRSNGERLWRRVEFWPCHDARGQLVGVLGMVHELDARPRPSDSDTQRLRAELLDVRARLREHHGIENLIGRGPVHQRVLDQIRIASATAVPVLVVGEPGTGRRTVARVVHYQCQPRDASASLRTYDCEALPPDVLERELFGNQDEAWSRDRLSQGSPITPAGTTVLLLEITELHRDVQARLAVAVAEGQVRLLATSSLEPDPARDQDRLRRDLYYALTTLVIRLPPLRQRLDELPLLSQHMLERANLRADNRYRVGFDAEALAVLGSYDWPGNLRELDRVVEAARGRSRGDLVRAADLPAAIRGNLGAAYPPPAAPAPTTPLDATLTQVERRLIERALKEARQNKSRAAELLDISRPRLYRRIKELNIPDEPESSDGPAAPVEGLCQSDKSGLDAHGGKLEARGDGKNR